MKTRVLIGASIATALLTAGAVLPAAPAEASEMLAGLQRWLAGTRDLRADFRQELVSGSLGAAVAERGRLVLSRPGRMRWDYRSPERKVALVEGDRTLLYLAEDRQAYEGSLADTGGLLPVLLAGTRPLAELFRAERVPGDGMLLRLVPRGSEESFEQVTLRLRPGDFAIERAEVVDRTGNRVVYSFSKLERNRGVDASVFRFTPPPGTDIVTR